MTTTSGFDMRGMTARDGKPLVMLRCATFRGADAGEVKTELRVSPGGCAIVAMLRLNASTSARLREHFKNSRTLGRYESAPSLYENRARDAIAHAAPELLAAAAFANAFAPTLIEVTGLDPVNRAVITPLDGVVEEDSVESHIFYLVAVFAAGFRLSGFAYDSENGGRLLRAVAPNPAAAAQAGSQGYAGELAWHQDNANKSLPLRARLCKDACRDFMNPYQAFAAVNVDERTPMEILALDDLIDELRKTDNDALDMLQQPEFSVRAPASHGAGVRLEHVPLLERDAAGRLHGRFHAANAAGLTPRSRAALHALIHCASTAAHSMLHVGSPGSLLLYSNTRSLHRRSSYRPSFRGGDRYFVRVYLASTAIVSTMPRSRCLATANTPEAMYG